MNNVEKPLISCIITSYKRTGAIVSRALDSILSQTYENTEVIIVDDNRGEGSETWSDALNSLKAKSDKVRVIKTERGHGAQRARNTGIENSRGKYLAFLDDDDEWMPEKLSKQVEILESDPEVGLCYSDGYLVVDSVPPRIRPMKGRVFRTSISFEEMLREDYIGTTSQVMIPRRVFDVVGMFDESLPARQDYEMWLRITSRFKAVGICDLLYRYHKVKGGNQLSHKWENCIGGYRIIYDKYRKYIDKDRAALFNIRFHIAHHVKNGAFAENDKKLFVCAFISYMKAFFTAPLLFMEQVKVKFEQKSRWADAAKKGLA